MKIFDYGDDLRFEKSFTGYFINPNDSTWSVPDLLEIDLSDYSSLSGNPKYLKVSLVSRPFGNQLEYEMDFTQNGIPLTSSHQQLGYSSVYQIYSTDMETFLPLSSTPSNNFFEVSLKARKLTPFFLEQTFPSGIFTSGTHLPYLLITSLWEDQGGTLVPLLDTSSNLSDNDACLDAPFTYKVRNAELREQAGESSDAAAAGAACGTIGTDGGDGPPSSGLLIGFALGFFVIVLIKRAKNFLS